MRLKFNYYLIILLFKYIISENFDDEFIEFSRNYFSVDKNADVLKIELNDPMQKFSVRFLH